MFSLISGPAGAAPAAWKIRMLLRHFINSTIKDLTFSEFHSMIRKQTGCRQLKKDGLNWTQVSDLKGWQAGAVSLYGIKGIPMNYLLDKNGIIVAKGLRGEELDSKLSELLH